MGYYLILCFILVIWGIIYAFDNVWLKNHFSSRKNKTKQPTVRNPLFDDFYKYLDDIESQQNVQWPTAISSSFAEIREAIQKYQSFYELLAKLRSYGGYELYKRLQDEQIMIGDAFRGLKDNISNFLLDHKLFEMRLFGDQKTETDYEDAVKNFISTNKLILDRVRSSSDFSLVREEKRKAAEVARSASSNVECICKDCQYPNVCEDIRDDCPAEYHPAHGIECSFIDEETGEVISPGDLDDIDWFRGMVPPIRDNQKKLPNGKLCHG